MELSDEEKVEMIESGQKWLRDDAVRILGKVRDVAWWDMFGPLDAAVIGSALAAKAEALQPGEFVKFEQADIPEPVWTRHRMKYSDPSRHGLKLAPDPAVTAVFRYDKGGVGMLIGYGAG